MLALLVGGTASLSYYYQDRILQHFVQEANRYLTAPVETHHIALSFLSSFPRVSVRLDSVHIAGHHEAPPLVNMAQVQCSFDAWALLRGEYVIDRVVLKRGQIYLHTDDAAQRNFNIFRAADTTVARQDRPPLSFRLQEILLEEVKVDYVDEPIQHHTDLMVQEATATLRVQGPVYQVALRGNVFSQAIRVEQAAYFEQKPVRIDAALSYHHHQQHWDIAASTLRVGQGTFDVSGTLDHSDGTQMNLAVDGQDTDIQTLLSLLPTSMAQPLLAYRSRGSVYLNGTVQGGMPHPRVNLRFGCQNASIYHPDYQKQLEHLRLEGTFTNGEQHSLRTSELALTGIEGSLDGEKVQGNLLIRNFRDHYLEASVKTSISAQSLLDFYPLAEVRTASGRIIADVQLAGRLQDMRSTQLAQRQRTRSSGTLGVQNFYLHLQQYPLPFRKLTGTFGFRNNDVAISNFKGYVGHSQFQLEGFFRNAIAYALSDTHPIEVEADLSSSLIDVDELLSGHLNAPTSKNDTQETAKDWASTTQKQPYRFRLDPRLSLHLNCQVDRLKFRRFKAQRLRGRLNLHNQVARVQHLSVNAVGGSASASGTVDARRDQRVDVRLTSRFQGVLADSLFYVFEDFEQDFLTARHLRGKINADVDWKMHFNHALELNYPSLRVTADAEITDGQLNNFEPLQGISKFVEDKNLSRLRFGKLQGTIRIADEKIYIPPVEVYNNVSNINVRGVHTFSNHLDYEIEMPMQGVHLRSDKARQRMQRRKKHFGEVVDDSAKPMTLFLTAQGTVDDYKLAYDFKKAKMALKQNLKEEKQERKAIFKNKGRKPNHQVELEDEYFDFDQ